MFSGLPEELRLSVFQCSAVCLTSCVLSDSVFSGLPDELRLLRTLLTDYDTAARPVKNQSDAVTVSMGIALNQIRELVTCANFEDEYNVQSCQHLTCCKSTFDLLMQYFQHEKSQYLQLNAWFQMVSKRKRTILDDYFHNNRSCT